MRDRIMTRAERRRWIVMAVEYAIYLFLLFDICIILAALMGVGLKILGVS
jgi:hypothetical protein